MTFELKPVLDALAERGRVIARKAYADWSAFDEDRRMLTRWQVELMAFERDYISTFVICWT